MVICESGERLVRTRTLFLRIVSVCYAMAFISLYPQIPGLYGPNGVLPVYMVLKQNTESSTLNIEKLANQIEQRPTLLHMSGFIGLAPDHMMEILCLLGGALAFIAAVAPSYGGKFTFFLLWIFYTSLYQVGQTFMWFQWDILLLEVGFLSIIVAPVRGSNFAKSNPHDHINLMLVRWLLFRMMFASGVVKLTSGCPTWWGLSALPLHYESQCIPTPLAWHAHRWLPENMHQLSVIFTYLIEIPFTFLFFAPTQTLRKFTFATQVFLMVTIMATGNYNFFNLLFVALCVSLMDDSWFRLSGRGGQSRSSWFISKLSFVFNVAAFAAIAYFTITYFFDLSKTGSLTPKIMFSKTQFSRFVTVSTKVGIIIGGLALAASSILAMYKSLFPSGSGYYKGICTKLYNLFVTLCYIGVASQIFSASLPVFTRGLGQTLPDFAPHPTGFVKEKVDQLSLISSYGLFRRMTGVGGRPEIVIEGANSRGGPWKEYEFLYKPGNVTRPPKFCLPHQPRLDWQMWFAALGSAEQNPWFISLVYRILQNKKEVLSLLDLKHNPFPRKPPTLVRAKLYHYHFTENTENQLDWWTREEKGEYLPLFSVDQESLVQYLEQVGILSSVKTVPKTRLKVIRTTLKFLRDQSAKVEPHILVWSLSWLVLPLLYPILGVFH